MNKMFLSKDILVRFFALLVGVFLVERSVTTLFFDLKYTHQILDSIISFLVSFLPSLFFFYLLLRKYKEQAPNSTFRKGTQIFFTLFIVGGFLLRSLIILNNRENDLKILIYIPILYSLLSFIWKKSIQNSSVFSLCMFFVAFLEVLCFTPFTYEMLPTPIALIVLGVMIILWFVQTIFIQKLFQKTKNLWVYWLYNISSPFWALWINGYKNEGSGSHNYWGYALYIVGAILLIVFALKKKTVSGEVGTVKGDDAEINSNNNLPLATTLETSDILPDDNNYISIPQNSQNMHNEAKTKNFEKILKKIVIGLIILVILLLGGLFYLKAHQPVFYKEKYKNSDINVKYLKGETLQFLNQNYPINSKRLVAYLPGWADNYMEDFKKALNKAKNDPKWQQYYDFVPQVTSMEVRSRSKTGEEAKQLRNFVENICGIICIIDTQENWVYSVKNGDLLEISLDAFKE